MGFDVTVKMPIHRLALVLSLLCTTTRAIIVLPAPHNLDDVRLANLGNLTLLVYNPAPITVQSGLHFAATGSFVTIVPPGTLHVHCTAHVESK